MGDPDLKRGRRRLQPGKARWSVSLPERLGSNWDAVSRRYPGSTTRCTGSSCAHVRVRLRNRSAVQKVVSRKPPSLVRDSHEFERDDRSEPSVIVTDVDEGTFQG